MCNYAKRIVIALTRKWLYNCNVKIPIEVNKFKLWKVECKKVQLGQWNIHQESKYKLYLCLGGRVVNMILTYDMVSNNVIFYFVCTLMMRIHIAKLIQAHLNWSSMGCLHQSEIKHRSLPWYIARSLCPPFVKVGPH